MWTPDIERGGKPVYRAVADAIADGLRTGRLAPGARLPPQRALAVVLGVDLTTITRAYAEARRRGLIISRVGQGTFATAAGAEHVPAVAPGSLVDMSMNLPPQFGDAGLVRRMWKAVEGLEAADGAALLLRYQDPAGAGPDRAAGAAWLKDRLPGLTPEQVLVSPGAQPAIVAAVAAVAQRGEAICTDALTYPGVRAACAHLGVALVGLPMDAEGVAPDAFERLCRDVGTKALYCTPTLQNPTTATMSLTRREAIVRIARRYRTALIEDDAYGMLMRELPPLAALAPDITCHIAGLAKVVSPALRIAYIVAPDARAGARMAASLRAIAGMASPLTAALATRWVETGVAAEILAAIARETAERRRIAASLLGAAAGRPERAFHLWYALPDGWSRAAFQAELRRRDVVVVPSDAFAVTPHAPEAVRIGLGATATRDGAAAALRTVREVLDAGPPDAPVVI